MSLRRSRDINIPMDFMGISVEDFNKTPGMERLNYKMTLMRDALKMFSELSSKREVCPRSSLRAMYKHVKKDLLSGLKVIGKKIPIYVELPKAVEVGNGQVKKITDEDSSLDEEVEVTSPIIAQTTVVPHKTDD